MAWLRRDTAELGLVAAQLGLTPEEAVRALTLGAKYVVMGYTDEAIRNMERDYMEMRRKAYERGWGK